MSIRISVAIALLFAASVVNAEDVKMKTIEGVPEGLSSSIAKLVSPDGYQIAGEDGPVLEVWMLKQVPVKPEFKPNFTQFYPFNNGQLVGAMRIPEGVDYTDFRGQQMKPGTYTLRYGKQPMDGNHVGTSQTYDFLLALPAKADTKTDPIGDFYKLSELSAKAVGSTHPAIFSLQDPSKATREATLEQDSFTQHWILNFTATADADGKKTDLKMRLVVIGQFAG